MVTDDRWSVGCRNNTVLDVPVAESIAQLKQVDALSRMYFFDLMDKGRLRVIRKTRLNQIDYLLSLNGLTQEPRRVVHMPWKWLFIALVGLVFGGLWFVLAAITGDMFANFRWPGLILGLSVAMLSVGIFFIKMERKDVFVSPHAGVALVEFVVNRPSKSQYREFIEMLVNAIQQNEAERGLSLQKQLAGEMRMLRRLKDEGVLDNDVYDQAKMSILQLSDNPVE